MGNSKGGRGGLVIEHPTTNGEVLGLILTWSTVLGH